jgi:hypothetical protein
MTYGELRRIPAGWVTSHVIDDAFNNARFEFGKKFMDEPVSDYDLRTIRERAIHFGEPLPAALTQVAIADPHASDCATWVGEPCKCSLRP